MIPQKIHLAQLYIASHMPPDVHNGIFHLGCAVAFSRPRGRTAIRRGPAGWSVVATSPPAAHRFLARTVAEDCAKAFGQPFIVENRPGARRHIGVELVVRAPADGHMLFVTALDRSASSNLWTPGVQSAPTY
jgi:hypothetical protein